MGHATEPFTTVAYVLRQHLRQKKDVVYGLLFLLHDSVGLRDTNPIRNPFFLMLQESIKYDYYRIGPFFLAVLIYILIGTISKKYLLQYQ